MKSRTNKLLLSLSAALLVAVASSTSHAQDRQSNTAQQVETDQIQQLALTPEQRERIRAIFEENNDERQLTNRRVREANIALNTALDAEQIDENLIQQRVNDLSAAQTAQMRLRIRTELKIRRELRPEQLATWRRLRRRVRNVMSSERPLNRQGIRDVRQNRRNNVVPRRNRP